MSFANLKKQSRLGSLTSKLTTEIEKMNKGHMITFNHPDTEAQDRNGLVERYIGL